MIGASASHRALPAVGLRWSSGSNIGSDEEDAGLQAEQREGVAAIHGQGFDGGAAHRVAHGGVGEIEGFRGAAHVQGYRFGLHAEGEVDGSRLVDEQLGGARLGGKAAGTDGDQIVRGGNDGKDVEAGGVGNLVIGIAGFLCGERDGGARDQRAGGVLDNAAKRSCCGLAECNGCDGEDATKHPSR